MNLLFVVYWSYIAIAYALGQFDPPKWFIAVVFFHLLIKSVFDLAKEKWG